MVLRSENLEGEVGEEGKIGLFLVEDDEVLQVSLGELETEEDWETEALAETVRQRRVLEVIGVEGVEDEVEKKLNPEVVGIGLVLVVVVSLGVVVQKACRQRLTIEVSGDERGRDQMM